MFVQRHRSDAQITHSDDTLSSGRTSRRLAAILAAALLPLGLGGTMAAASASPSNDLAPGVTCSGYGCDNTDPMGTGCAANAYTANSVQLAYRGVNWALLEIRYSRTCGTNWARITQEAGSGYLKQDRVCRTTGSRQGCTSTDQGNDQVRYSNQLYAPHDCARADGAIYLPQYGGWLSGSVTAC